MRTTATQMEREKNQNETVKEKEVKEFERGKQAGNGQQKGTGEGG